MLFASALRCHGMAARQITAAAAIAGRSCMTAQAPARTFASAWDFAGPSISNSTRSTSAGRPKQASTASVNAADLNSAPPSKEGSAAGTAEASDVFDSASIPSTPPSEQDWSASFHGLGSEPFPKEISDILLAPIDPDSIEIKPDGLIYLPEIKYRRILNKAFGPGGWGMHPRGDHNIGTKIVSREYALICLGRMVSIARGEQEYFDPSGIPTATEGCKSNALMRNCKDLGIASELWDPRFIGKFKAKYGQEVWAEHVATKKKRKLWRRKDDKLSYPYEEK